MPHVVHAPNVQLSDWVLDQFPDGYRGWGVDVGASDGVSINSTWRLEKEDRWTILSVEANPDFAKALRRERAFVHLGAVADYESAEHLFSINLDNPEAYSALDVLDHPVVKQFAGKEWKGIHVPVTTVDALLRKWQFPRLDLLCVDVEGGEAAVLRGAKLDFWKPKAVIVESWQQGALDPVLLPYGYRRVWRSVGDDLYTWEET